jgi:hypothetical protein
VLGLETLKTWALTRRLRQAAHIDKMVVTGF